MSKYTTVANVAKYYRDLEYSASDSYITSGDIDMFIEDESAYIDAKIRGKYTLPISGDDDLRILKKIVEWRVVYEIDGILRENDQEGAMNFKRNTRKKADDMLMQLIKGTMKLTSSRKSVAKIGSTDSKGNTVEPYFSLDKAKSKTNGMIGDTENGLCT